MTTTDIAAARRRFLLEAPILPAIARLAAPTTLVLLVQILAGVAETWFISFQGLSALAGGTLVFPCLMLMQMVSNGGLGAGVSSAVARAVGAGRRDDADALVLAAIVLGLVIGLLFTAGQFLGGRALYQLMGGSGEALEAALLYADLIFGAAVLIWIVNLLASALRGSGSPEVPARVSVIAMVVTLPLSPALIFGWGPFPAMGIAGAGLGLDIHYLLTLILLIVHLRSGKSTLHLRGDLSRLKADHFRDILKVGGFGAIGAIVPNLSVVIITGTVGRFGPEALAGYGMASRLDYLITPLLFGIGTGVLAMVGTNLGAGLLHRVRQISWIGAWAGAGVAGAIGIAAALFPEAWLGLFSRDAGMIATGTGYLHTVGLFYALTGFSMLLGMAGQGAGRAVWPLVGSLMRLCVGAIGGTVLVVGFGLGLQALFVMIVIGGALSCLVMIFSQRAADARLALREA
jgi:putative MATE family efflux protein